MRLLQVAEEEKGEKQCAMHNRNNERAEHAELREMSKEASSLRQVHRQAQAWEPSLLQPRQLRLRVAKALQPPGRARANRRHSEEPWPRCKHRLQLVDAHAQRHVVGTQRAAQETHEDARRIKV